MRLTCLTAAGATRDMSRATFACHVLCHVAAREGATWGGGGSCRTRNKGRLVHQPVATAGQLTETVPQAGYLTKNEMSRCPFSPSLFCLMLSVSLYVCLSICLPVCMSVCLYVCLSLSDYLSVCLGLFRFLSLGDSFKLRLKKEWLVKVEPWGAHTYT